MNHLNLCVDSLLLYIFYLSLIVDFLTQSIIITMYHIEKFNDKRDFPDTIKSKHDFDSFKIVLTFIPMIFFFIELCETLIIFSRQIIS